MARVVLGINADAGAALSALESIEEQAAAIRVAICVARMRAAFKLLALPETHVRCTWDTGAGWALLRVVMFDGRRVARRVEGEGLGALEVLSREGARSEARRRVLMRFR